MAKPHYFPFYYQDFFQGTRHFSLAQRGAYLEMLTECWELGTIKDKHITHIKAQLNPEEWGEVMAKFTHVKGGGYRHKKVDTIRVSVDAKAKIARQNGQLGGRPPKPRNNPGDNPEGNPKGTQNESFLNLKSEILNPKTKSLKVMSDKTTQNIPTLDPLRKKEWPTFFKLTEGRRKFANDAGVKNPEKLWNHWKAYVKSNNIQKADWNAAWEAWCLDPITQKNQLTEVTTTEGDEPYAYDS